MMRSRIVLSFFLVLFLAPVPAPAQSQAAWPTFGHDAQHTGRSSYSGPQTLTAPTVTNVVDPLGAGGIIDSGSPVIDGNGVIYLSADRSVGGLQQGVIYAFNPDGTPRTGWPFFGPVGDASILLAGSPAVAPDGTIVAAFGNKVYAIKPDGSPKWGAPFTTANVVPASPVIAPDGTIYVCAFASYLYAIKPDGSPQWNVPGFDCGPAKTPALALDGTIYAAGGPNLGGIGGLTALKADGSPRWYSSYGGDLLNPTHFSAPLVAPDGKIYAVRTFHSGGSDIVALDAATGGIVHHRGIAGLSANLLGITPNGTILCPTIDKLYTEAHLLGLPPDLGTPRFDFPLLPHTVSAPAIGADGTIYLAMDHANGSSRVLALSEAGSFKGDFIAPAARMGSPALASDGTLYFGSTCCFAEAGKLYAFNSVFQRLTVSPQSLAFAYQAGTSNPIPPQVVHVSSPSPLNFSAVAGTIPSGGNWLSVQPTTGRTPQDLAVNVAQGLPAGTYNGQIAINAPTTSPVVVAVQLTVAPEPPTCTPPQVVYPDNSAAAGLAEGFVVNQRLDAGRRMADVSIENDLRVWIGFYDQAIGPNVTFTPNLTLGLPGQMAGLGLIPPCRSGQYGLAVQCVNPGLAAWTASYCKPDTVSLKLGLTPASASLTLLDQILDGPFTLTAGLISDLETVPDFRDARNCLLQSNRSAAARAICAMHALGQLAKNDSELAAFRDVLYRHGIDLTWKLLIKLLTGMSPGTLQALGDLVTLELQTKSSDHPGMMIVKFVGR